MHTLKSFRYMERIRVTRVYNGRWHRDNVEEYLVFLKEEQATRLAGKNVELRANDVTIALFVDGRPSNQHVMVPKLPQRATGEVTFRSSGDYIFREDGKDEPSYGPKLTKDMLRDYGWEVEIEPDRTLQYHVEE